MLASAPGFLIVLATWSTATSTTARFFAGLLLGLSIAVLVAGVVVLVHDHGLWRRGEKRLRHP